MALRKLAVVEDDLLTKQEVAKKLKLSTKSIERLVAGGKLREVRIESARGIRSIPRYTQADVDAFKASGYYTRPLSQPSRARRGASGASPAH